MSRWWPVRLEWPLWALRRHVVRAMTALPRGLLAELGPHARAGVVEDEAFIVTLGRNALVGRAGVEQDEVAVGPIVPIGSDQVAVVAAGRYAIAVDLALELGLGRHDRIAQNIAVDEVVGQLIERAVEVVV